MKMKRNERVNNYLAILNHVYETGRLSVDDCKKFRVTASIPTFLKSIKWVELKNKKATWLLPYPPTKLTAITLMEYASARQNEYYNRQKERTAGVGQIEFEKTNQVQSAVEHRFTFDEWIERLKNDPVWEYKLSRVPRAATPEVLL